MSSQSHAISAMSTECIPARNLLELIPPALHDWQRLFTIYLDWFGLFCKPARHNFLLSTTHYQASIFGLRTLGRPPTLPFQIRCLPNCKYDDWIPVDNFHTLECLILEPCAVVDLQVVGRAKWWHGALDGGFELPVSHTEILENLTNLMDSALRETEHPDQERHQNLLPVGEKAFFLSTSSTCDHVLHRQKAESQPKTHVQRRRH